MKIVKHIPNTITSMNLLCGVLGVICTFNGQLDVAFILMLSAAVCDFCDGLAARALKAYSELGKQLDSLADMVSFGTLPALLLHRLMLVTQGETIWCYAPLIIAVFSALRLAKFNIDTRQTSTFIGLPTPANALFWSSLIAGGGDWLNSLNAGWLLLIMLIALFSYFLVCEIPMFSLKFKNFSWKSNRIRYIFLLCCLPMLLLGFLAPVAIIAWYLVLSVALHIKGTAV